MGKFTAAKDALKAKKHKLGQKLFGKTHADAQGVQVDESLDARAGIVYFLAKCRIETLPPTGTSFFAGMKDGFISHTDGLKIAVDLCVKAADKTGLTDKVKGSKVGQKASEAATAIRESAPVQWAADQLARLKAWIKEHTALFVDWLQSKLKSTYGYLLDTVAGIGEFLGWLAFQFGAALSNAAPGWGIVTSISEMISGFKAAFDGTKRFIQQCMSGRGVELLGGHPSVIANSLGRHSLAMLRSGIKDFSVGTAKLATNATPLGTVIGIVTGVLQRVYNLIDCYVQRALVGKVFAKAKKAWTNGKYNNALVTDHETFNTWFRNNVIATPVIAALVLSSGFIGHPTRFLKLIDTQGGVVSQSSFDAGVEHIELLKKLSGKYLVEYGEGYKTTFASDDKLVQSLLQQAVKGRVIEDDA